MDKTGAQFGVGVEENRNADCLAATRNMFLNQRPRLYSVHFLPKSYQLGWVRRVEYRAGTRSQPRLDHYRELYPAREFFHLNQ